MNSPMMLFATFFLITAGLSYLFLSMSFLLGTFRTPSRAPQQLPFTSVLVAARNEEHTIKACLQSLTRQIYPESRFEIIVIDDHSSDGTARIATEMSALHPNLRLLSVGQILPELSGKQNAIALGVEHAQGYMILITDADCVVPPQWLAGMVQSFDKDTGMIGGVTLFGRVKAGASLFAGLQELDLLYLLTIAAGAAGIGQAISLIGNNFGFRRSAYEEVGGYKGIGFSVTEDMALLNAIRSQTQWKVRFVTDFALTVKSLPARSLTEFYAQRKRWALGGLRISLFGAYTLTTVLLMRLVILLLLVLAPWNHTYFLMAILALLLTGLSDFWLTLRGVFLQLRFDLVRYFPVLIPFQFAYNLFLAVPILLGRTSVQWKDRMYKVR